MPCSHRVGTRLEARFEIEVSAGSEDCVQEPEQSNDPEADPKGLTLFETKNGANSAAGNVQAQPEICLGCRVAEPRLAPIRYENEENPEGSGDHE